MRRRAVSKWHDAGAFSRDRPLLRRRHGVESGCTTIGGNIVNAPNTSWAYAGSGYFAGDISAVFV
ncbi:hypothetical protein [Streptomyces hokutonensis]|uniref:Uncharacterized protein n=1 Tax=Streptomyces hokutonensis TaxID=1306990 RepID=A0ABW6MHA3_9ACTN